MPHNDVKLLTMKDAAKMLGISDRTLRDMVADGMIKTIRSGTTKARIPAWYLKQWQEEQLTTPNQRATAIAQS